MSIDSQTKDAMTEDGSSLTGGQANRLPRAATFFGGREVFSENRRCFFVGVTEPTGELPVLAIGNWRILFFLDGVDPETAWQKLWSEFELRFC